MKTFIAFLVLLAFSTGMGAWAITVGRWPAVIGAFTVALIFILLPDQGWE